MLEPATYICAYCAQVSETTVDASQGRRQRYVEDCQVCCRPLILDVSVDDWSVHIDAVPETD